MIGLFRLADIGSVIDEEEKPESGEAPRDRTVACVLDKPSRSSDSQLDCWYLELLPILLYPHKSAKGISRARLIVEVHT